MEPAEVLRRAADVLRERGWVQGTYVDGGGACCVRGAVNVVLYGAPVSIECCDEEVQAMSALAAVAGIPKHGSISLWNDRQGRTLDEVLTALERAAVELTEGA